MDVALAWLAGQAPAVIAVFMLAEMRFQLALLKRTTARRLGRLERFRRWQLRREHARAPTAPLEVAHA